MPGPGRCREPVVGSQAEGQTDRQTTGSRGRPILSLDQSAANEDEEVEVVIKILPRSPPLALCPLLVYLSLGS